MLSPNNRVRSLHTGSLKAGDILLTNAFHEQYHQIGWLHFLLGRISKYWERAYTQYMACTATASSHWASFLITNLWICARTMWQHCNHIIHGATAAELAGKTLATIRSTVLTLFQEFRENPEAMLLPRHHYLFQVKSLSQRLSQPFHDINCWIRSVHEARLVLASNIEQQQENALYFFHSSS
jgi:hypothetical protein